jgi:hypothetical protein
MKMTIHRTPSTQRFWPEDCPFRQRGYTCMTVSQHPQMTVVVYDKDGTENHWSGLNPARIDQIISIEAAAGCAREA